MKDLTQYEMDQLTNLAECHIHTHPRQVLDQSNLLQLENATPIITVASGTVLNHTCEFVAVDPAAGAATVILPPAVRNKEYHITMIGTGTLTITPDGSDTISGAATHVLSTQWASVHIKAISSVWLVIGAYL